MKKDSKVLDPIPEVTEPVGQDAPKAEKKSTKRIWITGIVSNCKKLHVRSDVSKQSVSITLINAGTEVKINTKKSTQAWYSVKTADGIEGFCMKEYITVQE